MQYRVQKRDDGTYFLRATSKIDNQERTVAIRNYETMEDLRNGIEQIAAGVDQARKQRRATWKQLRLGTLVPEGTNEQEGS